MKSTITTLAFVTVLSFTVYSINAQRINVNTISDRVNVSLNAFFTVSDSSSEKLNVKVSNPTGEKFTIEVFSSEEGLILSKTNQSINYSGCFDFSTAVDGEYTLIVSGKSQRITKAVSIHTKELIQRGISLNAE